MTFTPVYIGPSGLISTLVAHHTKMMMALRQWLFTLQIFRQRRRGITKVLRLPSIEERVSGFLGDGSC